MKKLMFLSTAVFIFWTGVSPVLAQEIDDDAASTTSLTLEEDDVPTRLSDLPMRLNPQAGVSSFEYSGANGDSGSNKFSGGLTVEFGGAARKMETGLLVMPISSRLAGVDINSTYLAIPMMAKLRVLAGKSQSWYAKVGALTAFETSSNRGDKTNNIDVLAAIGAGGRMAMSKKIDFLVEATFNRGLIDAISGAAGKNYNQGLLVMAGMSFGL